MADFNKPGNTSLKKDVLSEIKARATDIATGAKPTNAPVGYISWNASTNLWEKWTGSAWAALSTLYAITVTAAQKWATARTITLSGHATGNVSIDGSANVTLPVTVRSASTTQTGVVQLNSTLTSTSNDQALTAAQGKALQDNKLNSSAYTASDVLSKLITVDGAGSGLDADLLDGQQGSWYAPKTYVDNLVSGLGTAATKNVGTASGNVMEVGAGGWLGQGVILQNAYGYPSRIDEPSNQTKVFRVEVHDNGVHNYSAGIHFSSADTWGRLRVSYTGSVAWIQGGNMRQAWTSQVILSDNILTTTGQSTQFPMTQKAVTDALNTKANTSTQVIAGTGLSGGGNLSADRTLSVNYGTSAGTAAQGNDSRIVNSVQTSGNQTIAGVKTFSSFPVTPSAAPTADYQAANKKYVDDKAGGGSIGVGQTWQNVKGSRAVNTTYTNTTGKPIVVAVAVVAQEGRGSSAAYAIINQVSVPVCVDIGSGGSTAAGNVIVPAGATYRIESQFTVLTIWTELR